jgi:hypothetical protein
MGNVINSCPNNKILLSSVKLNDPTKSCLNCSKIGYQLDSKSSVCICATGFYSNNNLCYPISCSATGYMPNPNDNTMLQLIPLPNNINFISNNNIITTTNNDIGYNILSSTSNMGGDLEPFNNNSNLSVQLPFASDGWIYREMFNSKRNNKIIKNDGTLFTTYLITGEFTSINLPYKIKLKKYKLTFLNNNFPKKFYILGANLTKNDRTSFDNNINWYMLDERSFSSIPSNKTNEYFIYYNNVLNSTNFSTIAIIITQAFTNKVDINQFHLYGTYEDNSCICAFDYYLPSGSVITYDNGILNGCVVNPVKPTITFYDAKGNTQQFLYNKYIDNTFYFYRTASDTCATDPTKNNIKIIPKGFRTNFIISNIPTGNGIILSSKRGDGCTFNGIQYLDVRKISNNEYEFVLDLSQHWLITRLDLQAVLQFLTNQISY